MLKCWSQWQKPLSNLRNCNENFLCWPCWAVAPLTALNNLSRFQLPLFIFFPTSAAFFFLPPHIFLSRKLFFIYRHLILLFPLCFIATVSPHTRGWRSPLSRDCNPTAASVKGSKSTARTLFSISGIYSFHAILLCINLQFVCSFFQDFLKGLNGGTSGSILWRTRPSI